MSDRDEPSFPKKTDSFKRDLKMNANDQFLYEGIDARIDSMIFDLFSKSKESFGVVKEEEIDQTLSHALQSFLVPIRDGLMIHLNIDGYGDLMREKKPDTASKLDISPIQAREIIGKVFNTLIQRLPVKYAEVGRNVSPFEIEKALMKGWMLDSDMQTELEKYMEGWSPNSVIEQSRRLAANILNKPSKKE